MSYEIAVVAAIMGLIALFTFLSTKLEDNFGAIKTFFLLFSLLFVLVGLVFLKGFAIDNYSQGIVDLLDTIYIGYIYLFIFFAFFFIINLILNVLKVFTDNKRAKNEDQ